MMNDTEKRAKDVMKENNDILTYCRESVVIALYLKICETFMTQLQRIRMILVKSVVTQHVQELKFCAGLTYLLENKCYVIWKLMKVSFSICS